MYNNKTVLRVCAVSFAFFILTAIATAETATSAPELALMLKTTELHKFKAKEAEEISLTDKNGSLRKIDLSKYKAKEGSTSSSLPPQTPPEALKITSQ